MAIGEDEMSNIINLFATKDIPLMLRTLADRIEDGEVEPLESMIAFTVGKEGGDIEGYGWGEDVDPLKIVGTLHLCQLMILGNLS